MHNIGTLSLNIETNALAAVDILYVDSLLGLNIARHNGFAITNPVYSAAPALLLSNRNIIDIESVIDDEIRTNAANISRQFVAILQNENWVSGDAKIISRVGALAISAGISVLIKRAATVKKDDYSKRVAIGIPETKNSSLNEALSGKWEKIFKSHDDCLLFKYAVESGTIPYAELFNATLRDTYSRLAKIPFSNYIYKLKQVISRQKVGTKNWVLVYSDNELLRDVVAGLHRIGQHPVWGQASSYRSSQAAPDLCDEDLLKLKIIFEEEVGAVVGTHLLSTLWKEFEVKYKTIWTEYHAGYNSWPQNVGLIHGRLPRAVLGNIPRSNLEFGFVDGAKSKGVPVVLCQHGISREISTAPDGAAFRSEPAIADLFLCYGEGARKSAESSSFKIGNAEAIGFPSIMKPSRPTFLSARHPVLYASTGLYGGSGNIERGPQNTDRAIATFELDMIKRVFANIPYKILYKCYPAIRYIDRDPVIEAARKVPNIEIFDRRVDLRYLLRNAELVISARATSTFGWCISCDRPFIFIDTKNGLELRAEVLELVRAATFYFDTESPTLHQDLVCLVSKSLPEIRSEYLKMRRARAALLEMQLSKGGYFKGTHTITGLKALFN